MRISEFESHYKTRQAAANALGVTRQSFYDWEKTQEGWIPDPWCFKAEKLVERMDGQKANGASAR